MLSALRKQSLSPAAPATAGVLKEKAVAPFVPQGKRRAPLQRVRQVLQRAGTFCESPLRFPGSLDLLERPALGFRNLSI